MNFNRMLERKGVRRFVHRSGTSKTYHNVCRTILKLSLLVGGFLLVLWFIIVINYSTSTLYSPSSSFLTLLPEEPVWTPYQLTPMEVLTGHFSEKAIYTGIYQYQQISNVSTKTNNVATNENNYRLFFPVDYQSSNVYNSTANDERNYEHDDVSLLTYIVTQSGNKGHESPNQDRSILIQGIKYHRNERSHEQRNDFFLAALFDGHGDLGHVTSHVAVTNLPLLLLQSIQMIQNSNNQETVADDLIPKIIRDAFDTIDTRSVIAQVPRGGSTAVLVVRFKNTVYIASAGDSTAYLIQWFDTNHNDSTSIRTTDQKVLPYSILKSAVQHKPTNPLERKRIEENGGRVYIPRQGSHESSRVIYESIDEGGQMVQTGLAMSRSLGDTTAKELRVVISDPDIVTYTLPDSNNLDSFFIILASDGLMDVTDLSDLIIPVGTSLYGDERASMPLQTVCHTIVQRAIDTWNLATGNQYRDDITLLVHKVS
jgi:serine/threonine protein phosphatase PrpC